MFVLFGFSPLQNKISLGNRTRGVRYPACFTVVESGLGQTGRIHVSIKQGLFSHMAAERAPRPRGTYVYTCRRATTSLANFGANVCCCKKHNSKAD